MAKPQPPLSRLLFLSAKVVMVRRLRLPLLLEKVVLRSILLPLSESLPLLVLLLSVSNFRIYFILPGWQCLKI